MTHVCKHLSIVVAAAVVLSAGGFARAQEIAAPHSGELKKLGGKFLTKGFKSSWSPDGKRIVFGGGSHVQIRYTVPTDVNLRPGPPASTLTATSRLQRMHLTPAFPTRSPFAPATRPVVRITSTPCPDTITRCDMCEPYVTPPALRPSQLSLDPVADPVVDPVVDPEQAKRVEGSKVEGPFPLLEILTEESLDAIALAYKRASVSAILV